jgi:hypothetical protein
MYKYDIINQYFLTSPGRPGFRREDHILMNLKETRHGSQILLALDKVYWWTLVILLTLSRIFGLKEVKFLD